MGKFQFLTPATPYSSLLRELSIFDKLFVSKELAFNMQAQTQTNWCWAATSTSVSHFYWGLSPWTQCKVANGELGHSDCCNSPVPSPCNVPWFLDKALTRTNNFVSFSGQATFQQVVDEINAGRPVGTRIGWSGGGGHFMVIYGYSKIGSTNYFDIDDPIYGKSHLTVSDFSSNYQGSGTWTHTYFTKSFFKMPIRFWEVTDLLLKRIWDSRPLLQMKQDPGFTGDLHAAVQRNDARLGLAHRNYVIGLDSLLSDGNPAAQPVGIRVYELVGDEPQAYFDLSEGDEPKLLQMSAAKGYLGAFSRSLERAMGNAEQSKDISELRLLRIPALNFEAVWLHGADRGDDLLIPIRDHGHLVANKPVPYGEAIAELRKAAQVVGRMDDTMGS